MRQRFKALRSTCPSLWALEEEGQAQLRSFAGLVEDVFCLFYWPDSSVAQGDEGAPPSLNRLVLDYVIRSPAYAVARALNRRRAGFATTSVSRSPRSLSTAFIGLRSLLALDTKLLGGHCLTHVDVMRTVGRRW